MSVPTCDLNLCQIGTGRLQPSGEGIRYGPDGSLSLDMLSVAPAGIRS